MFTSDIFLNSTNQGRILTQFSPSQFVQNFGFFIIDKEDVVFFVDGVFEFDNMKIFFEFDINHLISKPEFRIDIFMELDNSLVEFGLGHIWSLDEEGDPFISAVAVEVGSVEIISVNEVASSFIEVDHNVELVA